MTTRIISRKTSIRQIHRFGGAEIKHGGGVEPVIRNNPQDYPFICGYSMKNGDSVSDRR